MTTIVFETPGLIDARAFTTMGLSAKPNSTNPIGYFGTGLKYAIAVLVRLGAEPVIWIGRDRYVFQKMPTTFRGKEFDLLRMRREKWSLTRASYHELPYTTEYGKNWKAWMAFRELYSNTLDEGGRTYVENEPVRGAEELTRIEISLPAFAEAYEKRDEIFRPKASRSGTGVEYFTDGEHKHLYWRTLKVYDLPKPALYDYNFLDHLELTEDRTLAWDWYAKRLLARFIATGIDDEEFIENVVTADDEHWESGLEFDESLAPSRAFHNVMLRNPKAGRYALAYYDRHDARPVTKTFDLFEAHPRPWKVDGAAVVDSKDVPIFDRPYHYDGRWELVADKIVTYLLAHHEPTAEAEDAPLPWPKASSFVAAPPGPAMEVQPIDDEEN